MNIKYAKLTYIWIQIVYKNVMFTHLEVMIRGGETQL